jgi:hypothetical protein
MIYYGSKREREIKMAVAAPKVLTTPDVARMDAASRAAYFNSLPGDQKAVEMAKYQAYQSSLNRDYMRNTLRKKSVCPQSSGGAITQVYSAGATLPFTIPSAQNAFCEGIIIRLQLSVTLAAGTSAVYAETAGGVLNLIDNIIIQYNGTQSRFNPFILKHLARLSGYLQMTWPNAVLAGAHNTVTDTYLNQNASPLTTTTGSAQTVNFEFYVPFNMLHPQDVRGLLPIMGGETTAQILITCAPQALGPDPVLHTWSVVSGTGHAVTFAGTSTVQVMAVYRDGTSFRSTQLQGIDLGGVGTTQTQLDVPLTGITASNIYRQKIAIMGPLYYVIATIIDGQQSNKFATEANMQVLEMDKDAVGANLFWKVGQGTNLSVQEYFDEIRYALGQDLDEGIWPLVYAPVYMEADASNLGGTNYLDTTINGWTDPHYGIQLAAIGGVANITPRVITHVVYVNPAGLVAAS